MSEEKCSESQQVQSQQVSRALPELVRLLASSIAKRLVREAKAGKGSDSPAKKTPDSCHKN